MGRGRGGEGEEGIRYLFSQPLVARDRSCDVLHGSLFSCVDSGVFLCAAPRVDPKSAYIGRREV